MEIEFYNFSYLPLMCESFPSCNANNNNQTNLKRKCSQDDYMSSDGEDVAEVLLRIKRIKFPVKLKIRTLNGRQFELDIDCYDTIERLKQILQEQEGIPFRQQKLISSGKTLLDSETIGSSGLINGSTVYLVLAIPHINGYSGVSLEHRIASDCKS